MPNAQIDVVAEFAYDSRNPQYNADYRHWRKNTDAPYIYRYCGNPQERVYVEGNAITRRTPAAAERKALAYASEKLGLALLIYLVCELLGGSALIWLLRQFGVQIRLDFFTVRMGGSQWGVTCVRALAAILKFGAAYAILQHCFHLPFRLRCPIRFGGLPEYILGIGLGMGCAAIYCILDAFTQQGLETAQALFTYKDTLAVLTYGVFDALVISLMSELLLRGMLLPILRQFGDLFAVVTVAGISFLFPNNLPDRCGEFCVGLAAGYLMLKSGSIEKCVLMRVVYSMLCTSRLVLLYSDTPRMSLQRMMILLLLSLIIGSGFYLLTRPNQRLLANRDSHLSAGRKLLVLAETVTLLPWLCLSALLLLIQVVL